MTVLNVSHAMATILLPSAVENNNLEAIEQLLKRGASPDAIKQQEPVLAIAAKNGFDFALTMLLNAGANVHQPDLNGHSILRHAMENKHAICIKKLLAAGADTCATSHSFRNGRETTDAGFSLDCPSEILHAVQKVAGRFVNKQSPPRNDQHGVEELKKEGHPADTFDRFNKTALMHAAENGCAPVITALLEAKADVKLARKDGNTALHLAIRNENMEAVSLLAAAGAELHAKTVKGETPESLAKASGNAELLELVRSYISIEAAAFSKKAVQLGQGVTPVKTVRFKPPKP